MTGLQMKYFVLKPKGCDVYAKASRRAMRAYADMVQGENRELADELRGWADREHTAMLEAELTQEPSP